MNSNLSNDFSEITPYTTFAEVYDATMAEVPYDQWADFTGKVLTENKISASDFIADLGCGTGLILTRLQKYFPQLIGVDSSAAMLTRAGQVFSGNLVQADICALPFADSSLAACICQHDTINYILTTEKLNLHFGEVSRILKPGGIYFADLTTEVNVIKNFHRKTFRETHGEIKMKWSNTYFPQQKIIESILEFQNLKTGLKQREIHLQKIFEETDLLTIAEAHQLKLCQTFYDYQEQYKREALLKNYVWQKL